MSFQVTANTSTGFAITVGGAPTIAWGKIKLSGTFVDITNRKVKLSGSFVDATGYKVKVGGTFVDLV